MFNWRDLHLLKTKHILVIGDCMLDVFSDYSVRRFSPEGPIPVGELLSEIRSPGAAGNVARNVRALGCDVTLVAAVGNDAEGSDFMDLLRRQGICVVPVLCASATIVKHRLGSSGQQIIRLDREFFVSELDAIAYQHAVAEVLKNEVFDLVVLSDYSKGSLSPETISYVIDFCNKQGIPSVVDPKNYEAEIYRGATVIKPNLGEAVKLSRVASDVSIEMPTVEFLAERISSFANFDSVIITLADRGANIFSPRSNTHIHIDAPQVTIANVSGAGDTLTAVLSCLITLHVPISEALVTAVEAASFVCKSPTTVSPTLGFLITQFLAKEALQWQRPAESLDTADWICDALKRDGLKIVFTNGCFDVLHPGHVHSLMEAKKAGDFLIVAVNSDASVKALKGPARPLLNIRHRIQMLRALSCVDLVVEFNDLTPLRLIETLRPDALIKGDDYHLEDVVGADTVLNSGGQVIFIKRIDELSTTSLVQQIKSSNGSEVEN